MKAEFKGGNERQFDVAVCLLCRALRGQIDPSGTRLGGVWALPGRSVVGARH